MMTSRLLKDAPATSSAEASPARTCPTPVLEQDSTATGQVFGTKCSGSFAWFDRDTSSWRTSQLCLTGEWELWSEGWPRAGTIVSGTASRHVPLAPLTGGTASGLLPAATATAGEHFSTPTAGDSRGAGPNQHTRTLGRQIKQQTGGQLNPVFVEWVMGYPAGWTDLKD